MPVNPTDSPALQLAPAPLVNEALRLGLAQADALAAAGQRVAASRICRELLDDYPACTDAWTRLAVWAAERGNALKAHALLQQALVHDPGNALLHANLCELLRRAELPEQALPHGERAAALSPADPVVNLNLACTLLDLGRAQDALPRLEWLGSADGANAKVWFSLGRALLDLGRPGEAHAALQRCLDLAPNDTQVLLTTAKLDLDRNDCASAAARAQRALAVSPGLVDGLGVLVDALHQDGRLAEAEAVLRQALAAAPGAANLRFRLALNRLEQGDYREGLALHESRLEVDTKFAIGRPVLPMPMWTGQDLRGRRLLVMAEQGFGDQLMFGRFVRDLAARGAEVVVVGAPQMVDLLARLDGCAGTVTHKHEAMVSGCDYWVYVCSLPLLLGVEAATLDRHAAPYLHADAAKRAAWRARLDRAPQPRRIGLVWSGRPENPYEARRAVSPAMFGPLAALADVHWYGLCMAPGAVTSPLAIDLLGAAELGSFDDTAALIAELDLLITVDTAFAHLAGGLGAPVWLMLPKAADWRWALAPERTPWYPSMRLFRQHRAGDWDEVLARVAAALAAG